MLTRREALGGAALAAVDGNKDTMPTVEFGGARISRLIVGGNPVSGNSHLNGALSQEMIDYFTSGNIKALLKSCAAVGINAWQSRADRHIIRLLHEYRQGGASVHWIAQTATEIDFERNVREIARENPLGVYHHGSKTDGLWAAGQIDKVRDALKIMRQTGVRVGLGTHRPEVIDYVESKGWDVDFYMTCVFNLSRSEAEKAKLAGKPYPGELFWDADRPEMLKRVRQTRRQCLIFKVYGATRHCDSPERMLAALKLAAEYAKPVDAVVIGMFQKHKDQAAENARLFTQAFG
jgi:hypothetical protein